MILQVGWKDSGDSGDPCWNEKHGARRSRDTEVLHSLVVIIVALVP